MRELDRFEKMRKGIFIIAYIFKPTKYNEFDFGHFLIQTLAANHTQ